MIVSRTLEKALRAATGLTKLQCQTALLGMAKVIKDELSEGREVHFHGAVKLTLITRKGRIIKSQLRPDGVVHPTRYVLKTRSSPELKKALLKLYNERNPNAGKSFTPEVQATPGSDVSP